MTCALVPEQRHQGSGAGPTLRGLCAGALWVGLPFPVAPGPSSPWASALWWALPKWQTGSASGSRGTEDRRVCGHFYAWGQMVEQGLSYRQSREARGPQLSRTALWSLQ